MGRPREAKRICSGCEVRAECLEYALENDERFGIWGGLVQTRPTCSRCPTDGVPNLTRPDRFSPHPVPRAGTTIGEPVSA
ncbi:WhiB family transcriptional regulator [Parafrankia discariae]|uniref:WhiB family transcriptional regulator n=1 Tax=Parafrankia discariae TaxID=365528 RepID=UPI003898F5AE